MWKPQSAATTRCLQIVPYGPWKELAICNTVHTTDKRQNNWTCTNKHFWFNRFTRNVFVTTWTILIWTFFHRTHIFAWTEMNRSSWKWEAKAVCVRRGDSKHKPADPFWPSRKRGKKPACLVLCLERKRICGNLGGGGGAGCRERVMMGNRKRRSLTEIFVLLHEMLERIVQDIYSHQEFVFLNILHVYLARYNFFPWRKPRDCLKPWVFC